MKSMPHKNQHLESDSGSRRRFQCSIFKLKLPFALTLLGALLSILNPQLSAAELGPAFTYQGRLSAGTSEATGLFDFRAALFDALEGGDLVSERLDLIAVPVTNGLFTLSLDFGADVFNGDPRWLQIAVRTNGGVSWATLSPRQPLTATPYATYAPSAGSATLASGVSTGAITSAMIADGAVTSGKLGAGAVKPSNIDDGGSAAYEGFLDTAKGLSTTEPLPFDSLSLVSSNGGTAPSLTFRLDGSAFGTVLGLVGREGISEPYEYVVEVIAHHPDLDPNAQVGRAGGLYFERLERSTTFAGIITGCSLASHEGTGALYTFRIESPLAYLALSSDYRSYQQVSVPDVVSDLYATVASATLSLAVTGTHANRESTIQFAETDFNFFSRLLEDEGIFYFFRQEVEGSPTLILADAVSAYLPAPYEALRYSGNFATNPQPNTECLRSFQKAIRESVRTSTLNTYDFQKPQIPLLVHSTTTEGRGEMYEFGSSATETAVLQALVRGRQERHTVERATSLGAGNAPDLRPGYTFTLDDRTDSRLGGSYLVTAVRHAAFRRTTNGVASLYYGNQFEVIPGDMVYRPALKTPKPVAPACTAVVTGPAGEEIWTDQYGRVKVQFHWDRNGAHDQYSRAWLRVASQWAGKQWGMIFLPRIGQEVMVEFVNGDPDQPVITGSLYNDDQMPPYSLPANKTVSGIKTRSSPGGMPANYNEIRFEDKKGEEALDIIAEKNLSLSAKNNMTNSADYDMAISAGHNLPFSVGQDLTILAGRNLTISAGQGVGINAANDPTLALNVGGTVAATLFQGSGAGLTSLPATALTGSIDDWQLSANVARLNANQNFSGVNSFLGSVGIGQTNPAVALDVAGAIRTTGAIRSGNETGTSQAPAYPSGSDGLVIRRARSTVITAGSVVARTDKLTLERDGTVAGLRLTYLGTPGLQTITCIGVSIESAQVVYHNVLANPETGGSLTLFTDAQKIVHYDISFGDTRNSTVGHLTHVVLDRYDDGSISDPRLVGTITSTYNQ